MKNQEQFVISYADLMCLLNKTVALEYYCFKDYSDIHPNVFN